MFWYSLLAALGVLFLLSVSLPVPRRIWALAIYSAKYFWLWIADVIGLRKLWMSLTGRRAQVPAADPADADPDVVRGHGADVHQVRPDRRVVRRHVPRRRTSRSSRRSSTGSSRSRSTRSSARSTRSSAREKAAHLVDIAPRQLASASIAQVHTARLRDGTPVVIKVQRPGIIARCMADMRLMRMLAGIVARFKKGAELANPVGVVDDFTKTLTEELDFRKEAANLDRFNEIMRELGHKQHPRAGPAPRVHDAQGAGDGAVRRPARRSVRRDQARAASTARPSSSTACARGSSASCSTASSTATSTPAT